MKKAMRAAAFSSKKGFSLIELLIVLAILAILAGIVIVSVSGVLSVGWETAYNAERESLQGVMLAYPQEHNGKWPTSDGEPGLIVMEELTAPASGGPYLQDIPRSAHDDSCTGTCTGHYKWFVTSTGLVYSQCDPADECPNGTGDGYQGVYP